MASSLPIVVDETLLRCPLCCRPAVDPRLLPCFHILCRTCLVQYIDKKRSVLINSSCVVGQGEERRTDLESSSGRVTDNKTLLSHQRNTHQKSYSQAAFIGETSSQIIPKLSKQTSNGDTLPPAPAPPPPPVPTASKTPSASRLGVSAEYEEADGYEVPNETVDDGTYEDVENDEDGRLYINTSVVQRDSPDGRTHRIERGTIGYVSMDTNRSLDHQRQPQCHRRSKSAPRTRPLIENKTTIAAILQQSHCSPLSAARGPRDRCQPSSDTFVESSKLVQEKDDGLYENSEDDGFDDVIQDGGAIAARRTRLVASAREVRRWKVTSETVGPPRLKRRVRVIADKTAKLLMPTSNRKSLPAGGSSTAHRRAKVEKHRELDALISSEVASISTNKSIHKPEVQNFEYVYGDHQVGKVEDDGVYNPAIDTLDRRIPVYDAFKSATLSEQISLNHFPTPMTPARAALTSVTSDSYVELEQHDDRNVDVGVYAIEHTVDDDKPAGGNSQPCRQTSGNICDVVSSHTATHDNNDVDEFACPVCDERVRVVPMSGDKHRFESRDNTDERSYGVACPFISAMGQLVQLQTVAARPCNSCSNSTVQNAVARCLHCRLDLCSVCRDVHVRQRSPEVHSGEQHNVVDVGDLQSGRYQRELILSGLSEAPCQRHPSRSAVGYCTFCDAAVCLECMTADVVGAGCRHGHKDVEHLVLAVDSTELVEAANRERDLVSKTLLVDVDRRASQLRLDGEHIDAYRRDVEFGRQEALDAVDQQRVRLIKTINECYQDMVQSINEEYKYELDNIRNITAAFDKNLSRIDHAARLVRQIFEFGRPMDVTSLATAIRSGLRVASRVPAVTIDARLTVDYRPPSDIKVDRIRRLFGPLTIDRVPCEFQTSLTSPNKNEDNITQSIVGLSTAGTTTDAVDSIDRRTRRKKSTGGVDDTVDQSGSRPRCRVRRKSSLREPVLISSFNARTPLDEKGCKPTGIAVADDYRDGRCLIIVVDDINKKLKVFDASDGSLRLEIKPEGRQRFVDPWDVAVLPLSSMLVRLPKALDAVSSVIQSGEKTVLREPRFIVSDRGSRDVKMFSESGEFVSSFGRHLVSPWGVATNNQTYQILVTDTAKKTVYVHNSVGNLLFAVQSSVGPRLELQCPEYVAVSPVNGDIVVTDFERHTVVFFDKNGRYLTQYSGNDEDLPGSQQPSRSSGNHIGTSQRKLKVPCGVVVGCTQDEGRVYIADYNNRRIVRLSRNGRYETCFTTINSVSLISPQAIDFTAEGHLVVADRTNVKIFDIGARRSKPNVVTSSQATSFPVPRPEVNENKLSVLQPMAPFNSLPVSTINDYVTRRSKQTRNRPTTDHHQPAAAAVIDAAPATQPDVLVSSWATVTEAATAAVNVPSTPSVNHKPRPLGPKPVLPPRPKSVLSSVSRAPNTSQGGSLSLQAMSALDPHDNSVKSTEINIGGLESVSAAVTDTHYSVLGENDSSVEGTVSNKVISYTETELS